MFKPFITTPRPSDETLTAAERAVLEYFERVTRERFCPFTQAVLESNSIELATLYEPSEAINYDLVALDVLEWFLADIETRPWTKFDPRVLVVAHDHPTATGAAFTNVRNTWRTVFMSFGVMISQMVPEHPDPTGERRFNATIPLLVVRRMSYSDRRLLETELDFRLYHRFFPSNGK